MIALMLDDLGCPAAELLMLLLEVHILVLHLDLLVTGRFPDSDQRKAALLRLGRPYRRPAGYFCGQRCLQHHDDRIPPGNAAVHIFKPTGIVLQENLYQPVLSRCGSF